MSRENVSPEIFYSELAKKKLRAIERQVNLSITECKTWLEAANTSHVENAGNRLKEKEIKYDEDPCILAKNLIKKDPEGADILQSPLIELVEALEEVERLNSMLKDNLPSNYSQYTKVEGYYRYILETLENINYLFSLSYKYEGLDELSRHIEELSKHKENFLKITKYFKAKIESSTKSLNEYKKPPVLQNSGVSFIPKEVKLTVKETNKMPSQNNGSGDQKKLVKKKVRFNIPEEVKESKNEKNQKSPLTFSNSTKNNTDLFHLPSVENKQSHTQGAEGIQELKLKTQGEALKKRISSKMLELLSRKVNSDSLESAEILNKKLDYLACVNEKLKNYLKSGKEDDLDLLQAASSFKDGGAIKTYQIRGFTFSSSLISTLFSSRMGTLEIINQVRQFVDQVKENKKVEVSTPAIRKNEVAF